VVTRAEIRFGIEQQPERPRRSVINEWLTPRVRPLFAQRVLPITEDVMLKWRLLVEEGRKAGRSTAQLNGLLVDRSE
jgi:predicted nucleic acid-binding protein